MQKVMIAVPAYPDGTIQWLCALSLLALKDKLIAEGIEHKFVIHRGSPWLTRTRDEMVYEFLQTDCTDFVFIDADVGFHADGVLTMLRRHEPVIFIAYPKKMDEERSYPVDLETTADNMIPVKDDILFKAKRIGLGCAKIARHVFEMILEKYPGIEYELGKGNKRYNFFPAKIEAGNWAAEDYSFSDLWTSVGGTIWVLADVNTTHTGQKTWEGNYFKWLKGEENFS